MTVPMRQEIPRPYRHKVVTTDPEKLGLCDQNGTTIVEGKGFPRWWCMEAFDQLPKPVRVALANAAHDWAALWAAEVMWMRMRGPGLKRRFSDADIIRRVEHADREEAFARELSLLKGEG
jgi:hypothetical protein